MKGVGDFKKFSFKLEPVLKYKNDTLELLRNEHARILLRIVKQEERIALLEAERDACAAEFDEKKASGIIPMEAVNYQNYLNRQNANIKREYEILQKIREEEERKKAEVLEARKESLAIEKLKELRKEEYRKEETRENELFIEEFVSNSRSAERSI